MRRTISRRLRVRRFSGDGFGGNAMQQAQAGRAIRPTNQEAVKEDGRVPGDEAARQLKDNLQTPGVARETARTVLQGVDATVEVLDGKTALQDGEAVYVKLENPYPAGTAPEAPGRAALEAGNYDGAVYQGGNGGLHYAVLDRTQLKSATDNAGTFDGRC